MPSIALLIQTVIGIGTLGTYRNCGYEDNVERGSSQTSVPRNMLSAFLDLLCLCYTYMLSRTFE